VHRTTPSGAVLGAEERIPALTALTMFLGSPAQPNQARTISPGQPADLCVLAASPTTVLHDLDEGMVAATVIEGVLGYER
jgi:predicted amidohydrolase YtcJ